MNNVLKITLKMALAILIPFSLLVMTITMYDRITLSDKGALCGATSEHLIGTDDRDTGICDEAEMMILRLSSQAGTQPLRRGLY